MDNDIKEINNKQYINLLKKPIILSGLIYVAFYLWFIVLSFVQNFTISFYEIVTNVKISLNEDIKYDVTDFLSIVLAILLINILYIKKYKEQLNKKHILLISLYLSLIRLFSIKISENFAIPYADMNIINLVVNDFFLLITEFIIICLILWVTNKISYSIKDFSFSKIYLKKLFTESFQIITRIFKAMLFNR